MSEENDICDKPTRKMREITSSEWCIITREFKSKKLLEVAK